MQFTDQEEIPLARTSGPRANFSHVKFYAIAMTNSCPVETSQCDEQIFEIERHTSPNVFCIIVGIVQPSKLLRKPLLRNTAADV